MSAYGTKAEDQPPNQLAPDSTQQALSAIGVSLPNDPALATSNDPAPATSNDPAPATSNDPAPAASDVVTQITGQRGPVYGPFINNAIVAQRIKQAMRLEPSIWDKLDADVQEGLEQFALKISRIVTGDPSYLDNWDDIGGYAKIVADRIRKDAAKKGKAHA